MLKQTITYKDFNELERTEDFYFNLADSELVEMAATSEGDLSEQLRAMVASKQSGLIMMTFKNILFKSYGEKTPDGRGFTKSPELSKAFSETPAYDQLFMRLVTEPIFAAQFVDGILPKKTERKLEKAKPVDS